MLYEGSFGRVPKDGPFLGGMRPNAGAGKVRWEALHVEIFVSHEEIYVLGPPKRRPA